MYLKAIEIQGFKSFANRINLEFHDGITAIVGPNGSGKSNIADAVRWVLGEQSVKTLRSSNMRDVIFSGSSERKAYSYAYVSIIMDNSDRALKLDFDEVVVSRRVYRSGESEYLLNGSVCRLKDVQELFYDTGIGKEGYSIIGQGQIDRILSERPEERRELFDEAVGIVTFKRNKQEAVKKLEREQQSLERVNDIIHELETRLPVLQEESEKARAYLKLRDKVKEYEIEYFNRSYSSYCEASKEMEEKLRIISNQLELCNHKLEEVKEKYGSNQDRADSLDGELSLLSVSANEKELEKQQYEAYIELLKEQINTLNEKNQDCKIRIEEQSVISTEKKTEILDLKEKQNELLLEKERLGERVSELEEEFQSLQNDIVRINQSNTDQASEIFMISGTINSAETLLEMNKEQSEEINHLQKELEEKRKDLETELNKNTDLLLSDEKELADLIKKSKEIAGDLSEREAALSELKREREKSEVKCSDICRDIELSKSKAEMIRNMLQSYEGYSNAIKKIMDTKEKNPGIIGVVADIITIESRYETAIETALGSRIQNIIVQNDDIAKNLIELLKKNKYGRATFLPLNHMNPHSSKGDNALLKEKGVIAHACDLVSVEKEYREVIGNLLGNILVVDTIENAILISKKYRQSVRMVTLQGELFAIGGSITGGDFKKSYHFLGRKNELLDLDERVGELEQALKQSETQKEVIAESIRQKKEKLFALREEEKGTVSSINELRIHSQNIRNLVNTMQNQLEEIDFEIEAKEKRLKDLAVEMQDNEERISKNKEYIEKLNSQRADCQSEEDEMKKKSLELAHTLENERIHLATMNQELSFHEHSLSRLNEERQEMKRTINRLSEQASGALGEIEKKQAEIESVKKSIEKSKLEHQQLLKEIEEKTSLKAELIQTSKELFRSLDEYKNEYQLLSEENNRMIRMQEKNETDIQTQLDYMWNEYELSLSLLKEMPVTSKKDRRKLESEMKEHKKEMKEFGPVNLLSIEEYTEVKERFDFLSEQRADIEHSEEALRQLIEELDTGMCEQFKERFLLIAEYFDRIFKKLFGGGSASLEMVDGSNLLETGIMINVQPPGKKLQNMLVLSGGEKALTAIALLFAIQSLKPSPFCLLDEIEAALDDSNVERFANYLIHLTEKTQFIIITHRKGTMSAADRLYGITMQEKGVSSLVSVNFVEKELD